MTAIVWFRRDLRLSDHPALIAALRSADDVVPFFCLDDRLLLGRHASAPRTRFLLECLHDLDASLRERGARLVVRHGPPERELAALVAQTGATEVHFTADVSPYARTRGRLVRAVLGKNGPDLHAHPGLTAADDVGEIATAGGRPFTMFTPFHRAWLAAGRRAVLRAPRHVPTPTGLDPGRIPTAEELGLRGGVERPARGGESEGRRRLEAWLRGPVDRYADRHDEVAEPGTSRLSPYLRFGCLSPRALEARLADRAGDGASAFRRQLAWRDFFHHVCLRFPETAGQELQPRYRGTIEWCDDDDAFDAWTQGRTGFPLVDAGMRQLRREGWMHNRARLVVGSFLTKDLGQDWRRGERHFMRLLLDGDQANNNGNWQWIASVGTDPAPVFRRLYNPVRHMERHDPAGRYVREYVPELRDVPDGHLREPWRMPVEVQRQAACRIGVDYPEPIVDRRAARAAALARYRGAGA
jgi:deoxyribodipyrimidine photo-lyase